jgi:membrane protease YdiL (CAAX protease family)
MARTDGSRGIQTEVGRAISHLLNVHIAYLLLFIMLIFWLNGSKLWGPYWEEQTALAYMLMMALALSYSSGAVKGKLWLSQVTIADGVKSLVVGFFVGWAVVIMLYSTLFSGSVRTIAADAVAPAIVLTVFYVALVEETIFRGILKEWIGHVRFSWVPLGAVIISGMFAIMHYAVYAGALMPLWWAFVMGLAFFYFTKFPIGGGKTVGVPGSIGFHAAYNLCVLGVLTGGIV